MSYRPNIQQAIRDLEAQANGRTRCGDRISITYLKGKFVILCVDRGGIKEGWTETSFLYTQKSVTLLKEIIAGDRMC